MYDVSNDSSKSAQPILPPVTPPKGLMFFAGTWSGRLIVVNTIMFILVSIDSGSLMQPGADTLLKWGAKDNILLAQGEFWRLITPIFLHIGLIHYLFNNWAIYVLGYQIEFLLKPKWFLALYIIAGLFGNIASALFSLGISAGASSSLFGLLGAGFFLERKVRAIKDNQETQLGPTQGRSVSVYTGMVVANLALGLVIPQIDNSAHIGGLFAGILFTYALLSLRPNRVMPQSVLRGSIVSGLMTCLFLAGLALSCSSRYTRYRIDVAISESKTEPARRYYYLTQLVRLDESNVEARWKRLEFVLLHGLFELAEDDIQYLRNSQVSEQEWDKFIHNLNRLGHQEAARWLELQLQNQPS